MLWLKRQCKRKPRLTRVSGLCFVHMSHLGLILEWRKDGDGSCWAHSPPWESKAQLLALFSGGGSGGQ